MGRKKITDYQEIVDQSSKTVTYNKRKRGIIKKAVEISVLCGQEVLVAIYNKVNHKLVIYQSSPEFNTKEVNRLLSSELTNSKLYEEHTNMDFHKTGNKKMQTFDLRLDNDVQPQRRSSRKKIWKIQNKTSVPVEKGDAHETESENDDSEEEDEQPLKKMQKIENCNQDLQPKSDLTPARVFNVESQFRPQVC